MSRTSAGIRSPTEKLTRSPGSRVFARGLSAWPFLKHERGEPDCVFAVHSPNQVTVVRYELSTSGFRLKSGCRCRPTLLSASNDFSDLCSCTNPTSRRQIQASSRVSARFAALTRQDNRNGDDDAYRVVKVPHQGGYDRAAEKKEDERVLVHLFRKLEEEWIGRWQLELVWSVTGEEGGEIGVGETVLGVGGEVGYCILMGVSGTRLESMDRLDGLNAWGGTDDLNESDSLLLIYGRRWRWEFLEPFVPPKFSCLLLHLRALRSLSFQSLFAPCRALCPAGPSPSRGAEPCPAHCRFHWGNCCSPFVSCTATQRAARPIGVWDTPTDRPTAVAGGWSSRRTAPWTTGRGPPRRMVRVRPSLRDRRFRGSKRTPAVTGGGRSRAGQWLERGRWEGQRRKDRASEVVENVACKVSRT